MKEKFPSFKVKKGNLSLVDSAGNTVYSFCLSENTPSLILRVEKEDLYSENDHNSKLERAIKDYFCEMVKCLESLGEVDEERAIAIINQLGIWGEIE